jgi:hypothetical protein
MSKSVPPSRHVWKFFRCGGLDQVVLESAADLLALPELDQKLWVALSCPVQGLELDEKTLRLVDTDRDGQIRVPEVLAAVRWAAERLRDPGELLKGDEALALSAVNDGHPEGKAIVTAAKRVLAAGNRAEANAISVGDVAEPSRVYPSVVPSGDGVLVPESTDDPQLLAAIKDILSTVGGEPNRSGVSGVTAEKIEGFFRELETHVRWLENGPPREVAVLGDATEAACRAIKAVRAKVDDYFARTRLAAFDNRAIAALNRQENEYLTIAAKDLTITSDEVAAFPLARVDASRPLPLLEGVNPAWAAALKRLHEAAVAPVHGAHKNVLTEDEWKALNASFAAYEAWLGATPVSTVAKLGAARARALQADGSIRTALEKLVAQDKAREIDFKAAASLERLVHYHRDLRTLLHNFVNFADFYSRDRWAVFQAGMLYLDTRSCELCIRVADPGAHAELASLSKMYIAYLECTRPAGETMKIAACFTQGTSDYLVVGRNGLFYDRKARDWDATIVKIIENPISLRQAFWTPYKKVIRMIDSAIAKRAATADAGAQKKLAVAAAPASGEAPKPPAAPVAPPAPPRKIDIGTVAALGVAVGAIAGALAALSTGLAGLAWWQVPLVVVAVMLLISGPSLIIAWLKLRQRTLGPILDATGWAVNSRVKVNIPFGVSLTARAQLPRNARHLSHDPYGDKSSGLRWTLFLVLLALLGAGLFAARKFGTWPF